MSSSATTPLNAEEIVASPAVDGDLNAEMRRAAKPFSRTTLVLAGLIVLAIAFGGGAWTHAAFGSSPSAPTRQAGGTQAGVGQQGGGFRGAGGRGTTGTVDRVDGTTVYVKTAQGTEVKVSTSDSTTVGVTQQGQLSDLKPGATVVVQGQAGEDGTVTAQAITQEAAR
ncbi:hypothetical protein [Amycolatopsis sp.]|uniref:hypothetical protein n=1 Tax=Amycolatopsis sp. TaxID=37632 RepID=UPI002D80ADF3|nr:hypothetical protein [Amycolatopsis sp.]HET6710221.1 hypothetical protein [Amycolatopsis sp.]